jgi:hypothetical protein
MCEFFSNFRNSTIFLYFLEIFHRPIRWMRLVLSASGGHEECDAGGSLHADSPSCSCVFDVVLVDSGAVEVV